MNEYITQYMVGCDEDGHYYMYNLHDEFELIKKLFRTDGNLLDLLANEDIKLLDLTPAIVEAHAGRSGGGNYGIVTKKTYM